MMQTRVVSDDGLKTSEQGCLIDIRLPWYRSLPLSVVEVKKIELDGREIDRNEVQIELNGEIMALDDLRPRTSEWWYVLDSALLHLSGEQVTHGQEYRVAVTVAVRPPYINGLNRIVKTEKALVAR